MNRMKKKEEKREQLAIKDFFDRILPGVLKFYSDHYICGDSYDKLKQKKEKLEQAKPSIPLAKILQKQREFEIEYAHNSTALAGNSLTLEQTRAILDAVNPPEHFPQDGENYPASEDETPHQTM